MVLATGLFSNSVRTSMFSRSLPQVRELGRNQFGLRLNSLRWFASEEAEEVEVEDQVQPQLREWAVVAVEVVAGRSIYLMRLIWGQLKRLQLELAGLLVVLVLLGQQVRQEGLAEIAALERQLS